MTSEAESVSYIVKLKVQGSNTAGKNITLEWILPAEDAEQQTEKGFINIGSKIDLNHDLVSHLSNDDKVNKLKENLRGLVELGILNKEEVKNEENEENEDD